jgi:hypothetical protein
VDEEINSVLYQDCPVLPANNEDELSSILRKLFDNESYRLDVGNRSRQWIEKYHSNASIVAGWINFANLIEVHNARSCN